MILKILEMESQGHTWQEKMATLMESVRKQREKGRALSLWSALTALTPFFFFLLFLVTMRMTVLLPWAPCEL